MTWPLDPRIQEESVKTGSRAEQRLCHDVTRIADAVERLADALEATRERQVEELLSAVERLSLEAILEKQAEENGS